MHSRSAPFRGFPGPPVFGRGVVIRPGQAVPPSHSHAPIVHISADSLHDTSAIIGALHRAWLYRRPTVITLADDILRPVRPLPPPTPEDAGPLHELADERLRFLLWANNYDLRGGTPRWHPAIHATTQGLVRSLAPPDTAADVITRTGAAAWIDGGPIGPPLSTVAGQVIHSESIEIGAAVTRSHSPTHRWRNTDEDIALASDQRAAVTHGAGAVRVIAPAGSGKTRVLTARIHHLVAHHRVEPSRITAVAYNVRAADELRDRLPRRGVHVRTIHALANTVVSLAEDRRVLASHEADRLLALIVARHGAKQTATSRYREVFHKIRIRLQPIDDVAQQHVDLPHVAGVFKSYRDELTQHRALDFDEQLYRAIELLLCDPILREQARRQTAHLLVDEVQDLTPAFVLLLRLLAGPRQQIFAVGDDDQTIYSHTGASSQWLRDFATWVTDPAHYALTVNYRCPGDVVWAADHVLRSNETRLPKRIVAAHPQRRGLEICRIPTSLRAQHLQMLLTTSRDPERTAVLARTNVTLLVAQVALAAAGISTSAPLNTRVLRRVGLATPLAYLRIACQPDRIWRGDLAMVLRRPTRKLAGAVLGHVVSPGTSRRQLGRLRFRLDREHRPAFGQLLDDLDWLAELVDRSCTTAELVHAIGTVLGIGHFSRTASVLHTSAHEDFASLTALAALQPDTCSFEPWLRDQLSAPTSAHGVTLTSIHRVKGREWDHVLIDGVTAGVFPHRHAVDLEEERRCFHVALTRCRDTVDVIADEQAPSPFLDELPSGAYTSRSPAIASASESTGSSSIPPESNSAN